MLNGSTLSRCCISQQTALRSKEGDSTVLLELLAVFNSSVFSGISNRDLTSNRFQLLIHAYYLHKLSILSFIRHIERKIEEERNENHPFLYCQHEVPAYTRRCRSGRPSWRLRAVMDEEGEEWRKGSAEELS